ncbi:Adenylate-forming reductase 03009 [Linum grandiflorum]
MQSPVRFASCRGVAFEIKPRPDYFSVPPPSKDRSTSKRLESLFSWIPGNSKIHRRLASKPSSHFCDLDFDIQDDDDDEHDDLEACHINDDEKETAAFAPGASKREQQQQPPPTNQQQKKKPTTRLSVILLDQGLFTVYKRLFTLCLTLNLAGLILAATGNFSYGKNRAALFSVANIFALTLCRSEAFLRIVFYLAVKILGRSFIPLPIKTATTSLLQSLGGIHSGCGISSVAWLIYSLVLALKSRDTTSPEIIAVASSILFLLCLSCLAAFPLVRHLHHNVFERIHRFAGWMSLCLVWAFVILTISYDQTTKSYSKQLGSKLIKSQEFWFTLGITLLIIIPWLTIRRVPIKISSPSGHASLIKFEGRMEAGLLGRISPSPLSEWHAFGIISDGNEEHMMLAGAVGDFTKSLVAKPPSHLWVRGVHFAGLPYLVNMYEKVVLVATGSGICVFLSFVLQECRAEVCVVWVAKGIEENFGEEIAGMMRIEEKKDKKKKVIVHDTAVLGRPNVSKMSVEAAKNWGAQVVIVTSNPEGSRDVVNACKDAGIPAFGPIWDS